MVASLAMRWFSLAAAAASCTLGCSGKSAGYDLDGGDLAAAGAAFVQQRGCPDCHTPDDAKSSALAGRRVPLVGTVAFPANLTPDRQTGLGGWADITIIRAIRFGIDDEGLELCPAMPRFDTMGDIEARAIVAYLRSLAPVSRQVPASMCAPIKPAPPHDMAMSPSDL
ncbi:MAG: cytochrome [Myxococcales bacterium]|nr:cytochrome [Myxococcales bacterium]